MVPMAQPTRSKDLAEQLLLNRDEEDDYRPNCAVPVHGRRRGSPTRDRWAFYCYSIASEIFSIVAVSLFMPITLEQFARDNGYQFPHHQQPCQGSFSHAHANLTLQASKPSTPSTCQVQLLGRWFDTASFPLYVFSIGVAVQAVVVCSLGDAADHPTIRKLLLIIFAGIGSLAGASLLVIDSSSFLWPLIAVPAIISNVCLGASLVCLNSFMPSLSKNQPEVLQAQEAFELEDEPSTELETYYQVSLSNAISNLSAKGVSFGFAAGISALSISLIPVTLRHGDTTSLRWAIGASAVSWAVFTVPAALWLPPSSWKTREGFSKNFDFQRSWSRFSNMLQARRSLKHTFYYLMAWFLLSDAFSTMTSTAIVFGKTSLNMSSEHLIFIGILTPATGILGALLAPIVQRKIPYFSGINGGLKMFKILIGASCLVPLYVSSSLIFGTSALTTEWEMFVLAGLFGILYGAFQSYARSLFAQLIPPLQEAKWYALFSITDKSSSFLGPFVVGLIADYTHNIRFGFLFILIILLVSLPLLSLVDMEVGKVEAELYALEVF